MKIACKDFILGRCVFRLTSRDGELLEAFEKLFESYAGFSEKDRLTRIDLEINLDEIDGVVNTGEDIPYEETTYSAVNYVVSEVTSFHKQCIWLDAATVVGPDDRLVLLAGPSFAGKTTLTLALAHCLKLKVVSEDITLVDIHERSLIPLARPSCFRPGTADALADLARISPDSLVLGQWYFNRAMYCKKGVEAKFGIAVKLDKVNRAEPYPLAVSSIESGSFIRELLPLSNLLRVGEGIAEMEKALKNADCYTMRGGTTGQRMQAILQMIDNACKGGTGD